MRVKLENKRIVRQGGSLMIALPPKILAANHFYINDMISVIIENEKTHVDDIFMKMAQEKMKKQGLDSLYIKLEKETKNEN